MKMNRMLAAMALFSAVPAAADAAVVVNVTQEGADVVIRATGTLSLNGLTRFSTVSNSSAFLRGSSGYVGAGSTTSEQLYGWRGFTGPVNFGSSSTLLTRTSASGSAFALNAGSNGFPVVFLPISFRTNGTVNAVATATNRTLSAAGVTDGSYVYTSAGDTITVNIGSAALPEPATWGLMLVGFGMVGLGLRSRRNTKVAFA